MSKGRVCVDEEVVLLEEQLATAHADIERLEARLGEAERRSAEATELRLQVDTLQAEATERTAFAASLQAQVESLEAQIGEARERSRSDALRYRDLVLGHEPDLPADLVFGNSIEAVEDSLVQARQTVAQVRQHLEQEALAHRVPMGAPVRAAPDLSGLSAAEKIRLGLQQG
jgi:hypothetical protein